MVSKPRGSASIPSIGPRPQSEWIGGIQAAPFTFKDKGRPVRPLVVLWLELPEDLVVGAQLSKPDEAVGALGRALQAAMLRPAVGPPRRPEQIRVATPELAGELRGFLGADFPIVVGPTPELDEAFASFNERLGKRSEEELGEQTWLGDGLVKAESVAALHRVAGALYALAPWRSITEAQVMRLDIPALELEGACLSIMGEMEENPGFVVFPSLEAYERFVESVQKLESPTQRPDLGSGWLALNFESGAELPDAMRREVAREGWPVANAKAYPQVLRLDRDGFHLPIEERDLQIVRATASALGAFFLRNRGVFALDLFAPVCESCYDNDEMEVRLCYPYEAYSEFDVGSDSARPPAPRGEQRVGRNAPCPCGSGRKYKHCCLARDREVAAAASDSGVEDRLVGKLMRFAEERFGYQWEQYRAAFADAADCVQLSGPWSLFGFEVEGATVADHYLEARSGKLSAAERAWLDAERAAWLSIWEVIEVELGVGLTLRDLLTEERRQVLEQTASRTLVRYDTILARVVDLAGGAILSGVHPRFLSPEYGAEVVRLAYGRLRRRRAVPAERLRDGKFGEYLIRRWEQHVAAVDALHSQPPALRNMDGDRIQTVRDRFAIEPGQGSAVRARLAALPETDQPEGEAGRIIFERAAGSVASKFGATLLGQAEIVGEVLILLTNSEPRADALRERVEAVCRGLIHHQGRDCEDLPPRNADDDERKGLRAVPELDEQEMALEYKRKHYASWPDIALPALGGKTPRQAARFVAGRRELDSLLKYMENMERRADGEAGFDFGVLRRELGLE